jgi:hypothetical protein
MPLTTARRRAGSAGRYRCNGISVKFGCCIHRPGNYCGNTCARNAASIGSKTKIVPKHTPPGTQYLLATRIGTQIGAFCRAMHEQQGEVAVRRIQGVLALAKKHGIAVVEDACAAALELSLPR